MHGPLGSRSSTFAPHAACRSRADPLGYASYTGTGNTLDANHNDRVSYDRQHDAAIGEGSRDGADDIGRQLPCRRQTMPNERPRKRRAVEPVATSFKSGTFDARPDRLDFRDFPYRPPLRSLAPTFPHDDFITEHLPRYARGGRVLDQGREGACTGFGLACVINYLLWERDVRAGGSGDTALVSPRMLYELARRYDEWPGEQYEGSSCRGALKGWHKHGVCADALWPYRTRDGDVRLLVPKAGWDRDATGRPLGVYYRVNRRSVVDMQAAILEIGALYVSARVHDGWDRVAASEIPSRHAELPVIPSPKRPRSFGGHSFALVGYNDRGFVVQNSWGPGWGAGGFAVMPYSDWVSYGTDAWAVALGVPQDLSQPRIEALRWPSRSGRSLGFFDLDVRNPDNPPDDPWPIDREFDHEPYQPWTTSDAYGHTLVTGNDGCIALTDLTLGIPDGEKALRKTADRFVEELVVTRPAAWLRKQAAPRLVVYAHGGLNSEPEAIDRVRVLAPYFEANGVYPLFIAWRTGPIETLGSVLEDRFRFVFGVDDEEQMRAAGFLDDLADSRDRRVEELSNRVLKGVWSEMRENAARGAESGRGLDLLARKLARLRDRFEDSPLEIHLVGHSAGAILLGHLLKCLAAPAAGVEPVRVATCSLYAAACSVQFAVEHYLGAAKDILSSQDLHLHYLTDRNEKDDYLVGTKGLHLYGKSLLYLVSRALDDVRKIPLLGLQRAVERGWENDTDQWAASHHDALRTWLTEFQGSRWPVETASVRVNRKGKTQQAQHGSFDNDIEVIGQTITRIAGAELVAPIEWLDY